MKTFRIDWFMALSMVVYVLIVGGFWLSIFLWTGGCTVEIKPQVDVQECIEQVNGQVRVVQCLDAGGGQ